MIVGEYAWLYDLEPGEGDAASLAALAERLQAEGAIEAAATTADRAYGLAPDDAALAARRAELLSSLAVRAHGLHFRYIPGGCYLMGSLQGDPDERPVHVVRLRPFWLSDTPVSWAAFCDLAGWMPPPAGAPARDKPEAAKPEAAEFDAVRFHLREANKIRLQYCEDATTRATDWHAHAGALKDIFGAPRREDPRRPERYNRKPMVAVAWQEAEELAGRLSGDGATYRLPTEAEWEAAARGGLIAMRYPWGNEPPTADRCDFERFDEFSLQPMRRRPPNGYGLYGMSGGVWEWTSDWYDALYYENCPRDDPRGPEEGAERVLRGGSWADCAEVVTVSFRMSRGSTPYWAGDWGQHEAPNIGFRLCRVATGELVPR
jgi:formylglycine-generating enzyme required for sulfatase activity